MQFDVTQSAISQHLKILREIGLVATRREGREIYYRLDATQLLEVYDWVEHYKKFWTKKLSALDAYLNRKKEEDKS